MIVLASASAARRRLIKICRKNVILASSNMDETRFENEDIYDYLRRITYLKGLRFVNLHTTVITADTVIVHKDRVIGKPKNRQDAFNILSELSGDRHFCFSGVTVMSKKGYMFFVDCAVVEIESLKKNEIDSYLDKNEYIGKAAAYAIQGYASDFVRVIKGDVTTVIGLPMKRLCKII